MAHPNRFVGMFLEELLHSLEGSGRLRLLAFFLLFDNSFLDLLVKKLVQRS